VELAKISSKHFFSLVLQEPAIGRKFLKLIVSLLRIETNRLTNMTTLPTRQRIAAELLAQCSIQENAQAILYDRNEFSSYLGMTRETLSRSLSYLEKKGFIKVKEDKVSITNLNGMKDFIESD
jgi:CRP/FNR family transcriptional regulator